MENEMKQSEEIPMDSSQKNVAEVISETNMPHLSRRVAKKRFVIIGIIVLVVIVIVIFLVGFVFGGTSKEDAIENYYQALQSCDARQMMKAVPDEYLNDLMKKLDYDEGDLEQVVQAYMRDQYGDGFDDITYTINGGIELSEEDLEEYFDSTSLEISEGISYNVTVAYDNSDNKEAETNLVYQYQGDWYNMKAMVFVSLAVLS